MVHETYHKQIKRIKMLLAERNELEIEKYNLIEKFIMSEDISLKDEVVSISGKIKEKNDEIIEIENILEIPNVFSK